ncbi:MAG: molybdopterin-dependent oxidoreductase, partial [Proteobacteria bacterium]|nr:molybdopterin-dependent oxidoreductase [Pseudomonadota bacterium]MBU1611459.1 molybdopterin-dependent oxidoreductase [Pseudomonadota bacterium]
MNTTRTCCTRHCGNGCALLVTEHDDGSIRITGDPDHPFTRGFLCGKTARFMDRLGAEDRIVEPMIKKNGVFEKTDWNEALDLVAGRINALRNTPERMMNIFYVASYGLLFRASPAFFGRLGATAVSGDYCQDAGYEAQHLDFGIAHQPMLQELAWSKRVVNWGRNLDAQAMLAGREVNAQRGRGLKVLTITPGDPGYTAFSDDLVVLRPGTDRFLALAVVKILMERGADMALARDRVFNWMEYEATVGLQRLDALLAACGVSRAQADLVADYYQDGPTASFIGRGLQRYTFGGENVRHIDALACCADWLAEKGGGVYYCQGDLGHIRYEWHNRPDPAPRQLPLHRL